MPHILADLATRDFDRHPTDSDPFSHRPIDFDGWKIAIALRSPLRWRATARREMFRLIAMHWSTWSHGHKLAASSPILSHARGRRACRHAKSGESVGRRAGCFRRETSGATGRCRGDQATLNRYACLGRTASRAESGARKETQSRSDDGRKKRRRFSGRRRRLGGPFAAGFHGPEHGSKARLGCRGPRDGRRRLSGRRRGGHRFGLGDL